MKKIILTLSIPCSMLLFSCGNEATEESTSNEEVTESTEEETTEEVVEETTENASYTLTDMIPIPGDKELTEQDIKYIDNSKERTINKTSLTLNDDGTFTRVFPHPSGDGTNKTWEGTYVIEGEKLTFNVEMNGKTNPLEFTILENSDSKLSVTTSFGQIDMNYIYTK